MLLKDRQKSSENRSAAAHSGDYRLGRDRAAVITDAFFTFSESIHADFIFSLCFFQHIGINKSAVAFAESGAAAMAVMDKVSLSASCAISEAVNLAVPVPIIN